MPRTPNPQAVSSTLTGDAKLEERKMKKIIAGLAAMSLAMSPAFAQTKKSDETIIAVVVASVVAVVLIASLADEDTPVSP